MSNPTVVLITAVAMDLADTSDRELRHFDRGAWALIIVLAFPIGPMLYLMYAKGPRRYS